MRIELIVLVFITTFVTDIVWTLLVRRTAKGKALSASFYSAIIILLSLVSITSFIKSPYYVIPAALGAFLGTYVTIRKDRK